MAEELNEQSESIALPETERAPVTEPVSEAPKSARKPRTGLWFAIILLMLIFGMAAAGFYFFSQLKEKQEGLGGEVKGELSRQISDYQKQLVAIQNQLASLQSEIAGKEDHFNKALDNFTEVNSQKLEVTRKELTDKVLQVQRQLGKTRGDWLIADAEYLLSVANERLHLVGDINTTREALEAADQRLRESGDSGTIKIREQIAKELAQIRDVKMPDIVGLYSSLKSLASETGKLQLLLPYTGKPVASPEQSSNSEAIKEGNGELLNSAIQHLEGIVTIKHTDQPVKEILTQEQADFIREQLEVKLELVKIALVQQNDELYQTGINDIKSWLQKHFAKNETYEFFMAEIERLMAVNLRKQFPDISLSLKMLRDVSKLRVETDKALNMETPPAQPAAGEQNQNPQPPSPLNSSEPPSPTPAQPE